MGGSMFSECSRRERLADGIVHAIGVTASLAAMAVLMAFAIKAGIVLSLVSSLIYGVGLVAMFGCSAAYNTVGRPQWRDVLRRLDHSAIFVMIAGTYTPFALILIGGAWGHGLLAVVWGIAALGIALQLWVPRRLKHLRLPLYLVQAWAILAALEPLLSVGSGRIITLLFVGGALYMTGVIFHLWRRLPYQNAIWHGFVLAAASCHYVAVIDVVHTFA